MDYLNIVAMKVADTEKLIAHQPEEKKFDTNSNPEAKEKKKPKPKLSQLFQIKKKDKKKKC